MKKISPLTPTYPSSHGQCIWQNLYGSASSLAITQAAKQLSSLLLVITPDMRTAHRLKHEVRFFADQETPIYLFPDLETLPYDAFSPHQDIISQRIKTLAHINTAHKGIVISSVATLMSRLPPLKYLQTHSLFLKRKQTLHLSTFRKTLQNNGYITVQQVTEHGEFAIRGSLLDLFPMGSSQPYRIEFFDDEIETIRTFDPETQRSIEKIDCIELLPAHEFPLDESSIDLFRENWRHHFEGNPLDCPLYQDITEGHYSPGIEYYLPLFFNQTASFFDYLPSDTTLISFPIHEPAERYWQEIHSRYEQLKHDRLRPILPPEIIFESNRQFIEHCNPFTRVSIAETKGQPFATLSPPDLSIDATAKLPLKTLEQFIAAHADYRILFCVESAGRKESLQHWLATIAIHPISFDAWQDFLQSKEQMGIMIASVEEGLYAQDPKLILISETQLFGNKIHQQRRRHKAKQDADSIIRNLTELHIGDPVVHIEHGIGRFLGLQTIHAANQTNEFLAIEYAGGDKLMVPVDALELISRYSGSDKDNAPLHRLGSKQWEKLRKKAQEQVRDVAAELLDIYARREAKKRPPFAATDQHYFAFAQSFPFEETLDQEKAIQAVITDMTSNHPMDRLICGDVGFGKTEVAIRAAFLAVADKQQVVVIVPTTLLAQQHFETFKDRFAGWPVNIEMLSRFRTGKEAQHIIDALKKGTIDIVIGTHKLLQGNIQFHRLGLVIIDEEHRFGVRQKEHLKSLRAQVDILTLTATPIPRTLNMSFAGVRDLSIISTPPERRLSVKTFIERSKPQRIREAILREIMRGGQIYYLHNTVETIERTAKTLQDLVPEARIEIAHGQMHKKTLESVMSDFYHRRFNVLICTTIIESGIDIPSANTIIIERADKFGLAQLHQLRGRVGRSHHQAYAYLLVPSKEIMTKDAIKRLEALESLEDLGAGFMLATHDLEIRGAGEFLGEEQCGHIQAVGFSLYMEMLEQAVKAIRSGKQPELTSPEHRSTTIELHTPALIPEDYLSDIHARVVLYKRISAAQNDAQLEELRVEMIDRFGLLPPPTLVLFQIAALKLLAASKGIQKIDASQTKGFIEFEEHPNIDPVKLIKLIQKHPDQYKLFSSQRLQFKADMKSLDNRIGFIKKLIEQI
ncbi:MAG: transcription-repair coupling factor [Gammaproteobacteria bacterium]|nr:transcription-repair coupling factor [Gammaproteobacteria bacterium]MBU2545904.1 transcription-repair coupling factor [Gammaproteobacteria bacterium]